jgi:branched-chain amino acid transport system substrate-binding protein
MKPLTEITSAGWIIGIVLLTFLWCGCKQDEEEKPSIKIGVLLPVSGSGSSTGESCLAAMNIAYEDIRQYFTVLGLDEELELYMEDTQTDSTVALQKITKVSNMGCQVVVGPYSSAEVRAVKGFCDYNRVVAISPSSVAISLAVAGDNVYRLVPDDRNQAKALSEMLKEDQIKYLVGLIRDDMWGRELYQATYELFTASGGHLNTAVFYSTNTTDFSTVVDMVSDAVGELMAVYPAGECGVYMLSFNEGTEILSEAFQNPILRQVNWYGGSAYAENGTLLLDAEASSFAASQHLTCPVFGLDENLADVGEYVVERLKGILGRNPEVYALVVYDAIWLTVLSYLDIEDRTDITRFKTAFEWRCNNYIGASGRMTLNNAGDRAYAIYDFWGMRLLLNRYTWYRTATYNNATGELIRY